MSHRCKFFAIFCKDFRLWKKILEYLETNGLLGDCDIHARAGGVKDRVFLMEEVESSVNLHDIKEVILCNHTDCGAYGKFSSFEEERAFHKKEMQEAKELILAKYPYLKVRMVLGVIDTGEVRLEEV
ncbi:MAG: hypothetical protein PHW72_02625 [Candidatus Pacebacteria bacterium]|nr:hypothetical protein [Candidatus Paceibacterota bacterium]